MNLSERFATLKRKIGGNVEKRKFEYTDKPEISERCGITGMNPAAKRILSELNFSLQLSARNDGIYDPMIADALEILEKQIEADETLTRCACMEAEKKLLAMQKEAKTYEVLYIGHAHIDMNWMWGWHETVAITLATFRTMLNLMREYPEFCFSQSQASVYQIVEEYDSEMMAEIRQRIREGRWEVTASAWVETDKNMPDTEALLRHIQITREYLHTHWGITPESVKVDFSPDTFGHSRFVPEINMFGGVPYYYHCRGLDGEMVLYRYRAPSGAEVLVYREPYWYNSGVCPDNGTGVFEVEKRSGGMKTSMIVYGVGNHGGGVTRRDVETMLEMRQWPVFPMLRFGTMHEYFMKAEAYRDRLPVVDHELNTIFTGCYSTQSRIKRANRMTEAALLDAERASALVSQRLGAPFAAEVFEKAWQKTLFTHFHDILTGSCVQESREYAMARLSEALAFAQTQQNRAYERWSYAVNTSMFVCDECISRSRAEGAGAGYGLPYYAGVPNPERGAGLMRIFTVFNPSPIARREIVELTIWDYAGDIHQLEVIDHEHRLVQFELLDEEPKVYWAHYTIRILFEADVSAFGHAVYAVRPKGLTNYPTHFFTFRPDRIEDPKGDIVLENEFLRTSFGTGSGLLYSLFDKTDGKELLSAPAGLYLIHTEDSDMSAWRVGRYLGMQPVTKTIFVQVKRGALRDSVSYQLSVMHSKVNFTVSLDKGAKTLHYSLKIDWNETCKGQDFLPVLSYRLPLSSSAQSILCDVPAGVVRRPACQMDVPALTGACADVNGTTVALISDCKYGFRLADGVLSLTLINTAGTPDLYPERGIHSIELYIALTEVRPVLLKRTAERLTRPMLAVPTASHPGVLPPKGTLMSLECDHSVVTAVSCTKDGALLIRLYEADGKGDHVKIHPPFTPVQAVLSNLNGTETAQVKIENNTVCFGIEANRIVQVIIYSEGI